MQTEETAKQQQADQEAALRAIIIANPEAGSYEQHRQQLEETRQYLQEQGWQVEIKLTEEAGDGKRIAREAVEQQCNVVIATGGDGTVNEVIQSLAGSQTALGVLPSGTVNVWAREIGVPINDYEQAREVLLHGEQRRIDLGQVNSERYFLLMSTIGLDAEVTRTVESLTKKFGVFTYLLHTLKLGLGYPNFTAFLQIGRRTIRGHALQIIFGNTQLYAGAIKFTWHAQADDGQLDICLVRSKNIVNRFSIVYDFLFKRKRREQWVLYDSAKEIKIHTNRKVALQVDGDPWGETSRRGTPPTIIRVVPQALNVIIPQDYDGGLFSKPASDQGQAAKEK
jgi:diacylglycerol kinase (ATP)